MKSGSVRPGVRFSDLTPEIQNDLKEGNYTVYTPLSLRELMDIALRKVEKTVCFYSLCRPLLEGRHPVCLPFEDVPPSEWLPMA
jgi:hypothetical protein